MQQSKVMVKTVKKNVRLSNKYKIKINVYIKLIYY